MTFQAWCCELQRRLPIAVSGLHIHDRAVVGLDTDPAGITYDCKLDLPSLIEVEIYLSQRAVALKVVTIH